MSNRASSPPAAADAPSWDAGVDLLSADELLRRLDRLQAELDGVKAGLARSHRLATVGTLTASLIHEYNNIMTPLVSYAQMALAEPGDQALTAKALEKALNAAHQAGRISEALLGFVREDPAVTPTNQETPGPSTELCSADRASTNRPNTSLANAVQAALDCLARNPEKDGITLSVGVNDVHVAASPVAMQHILLNLLINARKALLAHDRRRGGRIDITATRQDDRVTLTFADTGPGIPEHLLPSLFEPFVSEDPNPAGTGTGLGLAVCRHFVEQVGGTIAAHNRLAPDRGAVFTMELPAG